MRRIIVLVRAAHRSTYSIRTICMFYATSISLDNRCIPLHVIWGECAYWPAESNCIKFGDDGS
jgi:hypothetical protein